MVELSKTLVNTTDPEATVARKPTVIPWSIVDPEPISVSSPTTQQPPS